MAFLSAKYRIGHRSVKQRRRRVYFVVFASLSIMVGLALFVFRDVKSGTTKEVSTTGRVVTQVLGDSEQRLTVDEPLYTLELPSDWKEKERVSNPLQNYVVWESSKKFEANRQLYVYVDAIPLDKPVNRMLPIRSSGNGISFGDVSNKCETFTGGGTSDAQKAVNNRPTKSRWEDVDFMCNLENIVDNQIGTSSPEGINTVTVNGYTKGSHKYFFLFIDRNIKPNYTIFYDALRSFRGK